MKRILMLIMISILCSCGTLKKDHTNNQPAAPTNEKPAEPKLGSVAKLPKNNVPKEVYLANTRYTLDRTLLNDEGNNERRNYYKSTEKASGFMVFDAIVANKEEAFQFFKSKLWALNKDAPAVQAIRKDNKKEFFISQGYAPVPHASFTMLGTYDQKTLVFRVRVLLSPATAQEVARQTKYGVDRIVHEMLDSTKTK